MTQSLEIFSVRAFISKEKNEGAEAKEEVDFL